MLNLVAYGRIATEIDVNQSRDMKHLYTHFIIASHDRGETTFLRCIAFDGLAELLAQYFKKGDRIILRGDLISDDYGNRKDTFKLSVKDFEFVEPKPKNSNDTDERSL